MTPWLFFVVVQTLLWESIDCSLLEGRELSLMRGKYKYML